MMTLRKKGTTNEKGSTMIASKALSFSVLGLLSVSMIGDLPAPGNQLGSDTITSVGGQRGSANGNGGYRITSVFNDSSNLLTGLPGQIVQAVNYLQWSVGGPDAAGIRYANFNAISQTASINNPPSSFTPGNETVAQTEIVPIAAVSNVGANLSMGGTDARPWGNAFGMFGVCQVGDNAGSNNRRYRSCIGAEFDTEVGAGANFDLIANLLLVSNNHSIGATADAYLIMSSVGGGPSGRDNGILFTDYVGLAPVGAGGTLIKSVGESPIGTGIEIQNVITGHVIKTRPFDVDAEGNVRANGTINTNELSVQGSLGLTTTVDIPGVRLTFTGGLLTGKEIF